MQQYAATGTKSSVLSLVPPHNKAFVPKVQENMPRTLTSLYDQECFNMNFVELLNACENIEISIEEKECKAVEKATRQQAQSKHWMSYIAGRITASKLKAACHTDPAKPSKGLIKAICYPEAHKFTTSATRLV